MDKALTGIIGVVFGLAMLMAFTQTTQAAQLYTCPICPETFATYNELYQHFITEHPAESIDIIWE